MDKLYTLKNHLEELKHVAIAYSGGVDSTFLLKVAQECLGRNVVAYTIKSAFVPDTELEDANEFCRENNIAHYVINVANGIPCENLIKNNPVDRCYHCKKSVFSKIKEEAWKLGIAYVLDGTNADDEGDYRPGMRAVGELSVISPLKIMTKNEIREYSKQYGLKTWDKPAYACLASRIPYGDEITIEKLKKVELAEDVLRELGFVQLRVRIHEDSARIELERSEMPKMFDMEKINTVVNKLTEIGFVNVTLDLKGYRMGSLNEGIKDGE